MIRTEMIGERIRHYSDTGMKIRQVETETVYEDAVDVMPCRYTYEETDEPIELPDDGEDSILKETLTTAYRNGVNGI